MIEDLSALKIASAMTRHATASHTAIARNIAYADIPGATSLQTDSFQRAFQRLEDGNSVGTRASRDPISLDTEMVAMARNAGRHTASVTIWSETLNLVRLAAQSPR